LLLGEWGGVQGDVVVDELPDEGEPANSRGLVLRKESPVSGSTIVWARPVSRLSGGA
jgi:hypothetical protein